MKTSELKDEALEMKETTLWYLQGYPGHYYTTKLAAEVDARRVFPLEDIDARYARLRCKTFYEEK